MHLSPKHSHWHCGICAPPQGVNEVFTACWTCISENWWGMVFNPEGTGSHLWSKPTFPMNVLAIFNGKWDLISTQSKQRTVLSLKTQPAGNFVVPLGPTHGKLLDCRDFSEERLFHRKMLLCWNLKHSTGMCWFEQFLMETTPIWRLSSQWGLMAAGQSNQELPGHTEATMCVSPRINYFYQNVWWAFIKILKRNFKKET